MIIVLPILLRTIYLGRRFPRTSALYDLIAAIVELVINVLGCLDERVSAVQRNRGAGKSYLV